MLNNQTPRLRIDTEANGSAWGERRRETNWWDYFGRSFLACWWDLLTFFAVESLQQLKWGPSQEAFKRRPHFPYCKRCWRCVRTCKQNVINSSYMNVVLWEVCRNQTLRKVSEPEGRKKANICYYYNWCVQVYFVPSFDSLFYIVYHRKWSHCLCS